MVTGIVPNASPPTSAIPCCPLGLSKAWSSALGTSYSPHNAGEALRFPLQMRDLHTFYRPEFLLNSMCTALGDFQISQHKTSLCDALELEYIRLDLFKTNPRIPFVYSVLTGNLSQGGLTDSRPHGKLVSEKVSCCSQSGRVALLHTRPSELKLFYMFILSPSILTIPHFLSRLISTSMKRYQCPYSSRTQT